MRVAAGERVGCWEWARGGEPEQLPDLDLRVHAPVPEVVIVRVSGTLNAHTAPLLAQRVGKQLTRAPHVVVDLGEVTVVDPYALTVLVTLHQKAIVNGTEIHITGAEHDAVRQALRLTDLDQLLTLDPTADAVIASFRAGPGPAAVPTAADPARRISMGARQRRPQCPLTTSPMVLAPGMHPTGVWRFAINTVVAAIIIGILVTHTR